MATIAGPAPYSADRWTRWTTTAAVALLSLIAGVVSFGHMHELALRAGEEHFTAALIPLSVDGMIVASSMSLLVDSRSGRRGSLLPWTLLILGSGASLAANVAAATPTVEGRVIAAWPSFALMGAYELLMRQIRHSADDRHTGRAAAVTVDGPANTKAQDSVASPLPRHAAEVEERNTAEADHEMSLMRTVAAERRPTPVEGDTSECVSRSHGRRMRPDSPRLAKARILQQRAHRWALDHRAVDGTLPTGSEIAAQFGRSDRWGRLMKQGVKASDGAKAAAA